MLHHNELAFPALTSAAKCITALMVAACPNQPMKRLAYKSALLSAATPVAAALTAQRQQSCSVALVLTYVRVRSWLINFHRKTRSYILSLDKIAFFLRVENEDGEVNACCQTLAVF